jgi:hypothetical protein
MLGCDERVEKFSCKVIETIPGLILVILLWDSNPELEAVIPGLRIPIFGKFLSKSHKFYP